MNTSSELAEKRLPSLAAVVDWLEVLDRVRHAVDDGFRASGVAPDETMRAAAVNPIAVRNAVIRHTYHESRSHGECAGVITDRLSMEYHLSGDTIDAIVRGKR